MSNKLFTLLIIPRTKSAVKKVSFSKTMVRRLAVGTIVFLVISLYVIYDYATITTDRIELSRLRRQTALQSRQIADLSVKVDEFSDRMEALRQFDKKLRILTAGVSGKDNKIPLGIGGANNEHTRLKELLDQGNEKLVSQMHKNIQQLNIDAREREQSFTEMLLFLREQKSLLAATPSLWPVRGLVTSEFGWRQDPYGNGNQFHQGIDIATRDGKPIVAPADGLVVASEYRPEEGHYVSIEHGYGISTGYAHLSKPEVRQGMRVEKGQVIGYVGNTGRSTGSHLHYVVNINNIPVNPRSYLK
jgi:murein DD-endopeptidase MepM/ murein hydrolase activator NlpD